MDYSKYKSDVSVMDQKIKFYNKQQERVNSAVENLSMRYYNIAGIISKMRFKPSEAIGTFCVDKYGRGLFNPHFSEELGKREIELVVMHEVYHVLLKHMKRFEKHVDGSDGDIRAFNIAADSFINENLLSSKYFKHSIVDGMIDFDYVSEITGIKKPELANMNTEAVYDKIVESNESQDNSQDDSSSSNSSNNPGEGSSEGESESSVSNSEGSSEGKKSKGPSSSGDQISDDMSYSDIIEQEYGQSENLDKIESSLERESQKIPTAGLNSDKALLDWVEGNCNVDVDTILKDFAYKVSGRGESAKTYRRPNKYYKDIYPYTKGRVKNSQKDIVFSIDVSGSMDKIKISRSIAFIDKYQKKYGVGVKYYFFSDKASPVFEYTSKEDFLKSLKKYYGGGTSFSAALRSDNKDKIKDIASGVVIVSDMCFYEGDQEVRSLLEKQGVYYFGVGVDASKSTCASMFGSDFILM